MQGAFWIVYCIIDMTTDVSIIMLSVNLVVYSKTKLSRKFAVVGSFAPRALVIGASLARLVYLYPITPHDNPAFEFWIPTVCTQVHVCISIATACIPFMLPWFVGKQSSSWRGDGALRRLALGDESSYGCCSYSYLKGHKRGQNFSADSSAFATSKSGKTPDVSPRIPTPRRLSPLTPPRLHSSWSSSGGSTRRPSESGLRLHIPTPEILVRRATQVDITSPQTASSNALSPECLSPQPLLSPQAYSPKSPKSREPSPPPPSHDPNSTAAGNIGPRQSSEPTAKFGTSPPRFSLFPQTRTPRYSRLPQQYSNAALSIISERSRSGGRTPAPGMPPYSTPERRTPSPNTRFPVSTRTHSTPRFSRVLNDDPLRTKGEAMTTSTPVPAPLITSLPVLAPVPPPYQAHSSIPSYYVTTPPTAHSSDPSSLQTLPSYYTRTPPSSRPPTFTPPAPPAPPAPEPAPEPASNQSTSPQRRRNRRILTPQNSSRVLERSPVSPSPVSPPTPMSFWREGDGAVNTRREEEARLVEVVRVRDVRSSPRIVVQRFP